VARWYDPHIAHFVQADTIVPKGTNPSNYDRYAYTENNPINLVDPTGHCSGAPDDPMCPQMDPGSTSANGSTVSQAYLEEVFGFVFLGEFSDEQIEKIYNGIAAIMTYVSSMSGLSGVDWVKKYLGGTNFNLGGCTAVVLLDSFKG
jgi:hypothetical protein